jgi:hypothetical protein
MSDWPRPSGDELPELYEETEGMIKRANGILRDHFQVDSSGSMDCVVFDDAGQDDFLRALDADHEVMVPLFQKLRGCLTGSLSANTCKWNWAAIEGRKSSLKGMSPLKVC